MEEKEGIKVTAYDLFCEFGKSKYPKQKRFYDIFKDVLDNLNPPIEITAEAFEQNKIGILGNIWNGDLYGLSINGKHIEYDDLVHIFELEKEKNN